MMRSLIAGLGLVAAVAAPASAADLPRQAVPYKAPAYLSPAFNWTGAYLGIHGGYGWGSSRAIDMRGGFVGGQIGYNWQGASPWVFGVEVDSAWADMGRGETVSTTAGVLSVSSDANYVGSLRARLGYAFDRSMLYMTGGLGWMHNEVRVAGTRGGYTVGLTDSHTHVGGVIGAGLEHAFAPNWTGKVEYLYAAYNSKNYFSSVAGGVGLDAGSHTVKVGVNYLIR
jgi:outer membrane immunogenic protein